MLVQLMRVALHRHWPVEATTAGHLRQRPSWRVRGFNAVGEHTKKVAAALEATGDGPAPPAVCEVG